MEEWYYFPRLTYSVIFDCPKFPIAWYVREVTNSTTHGLFKQLLHYFVLNLQNSIIFQIHHSH